VFYYHRDAVNIALFLTKQLKIMFEQLQKTLRNIGICFWAQLFWGQKNGPGVRKVWNHLSY